MVHLETQIAYRRIAVRRLHDHDRKALHRLAEVDSARVPSGDLLGAEADDHLIAAISVDDGAIIADPFRPSASAVEMLRLRAGQLRDETKPKGRRWLRLPHRRLV